MNYSAMFNITMPKYSNDDYIFNTDNYVFLKITIIWQPDV